jgi:hypothetical protein
MGKLLGLSLLTTLVAAVLFQPILMGPPRAEGEGRRWLGRVAQEPDTLTQTPLHQVLITISPAIAAILPERKSKRR